MTTETSPAPTTSRLKELLLLAWPVIVSRATQTVVGLADALMVAHLGESALAAVTTGAMNSAAVFIMPFGIVFIVSSFSAQLTGKGDAPGARRYAWYGLAVALVAQLVMAAALPALPHALALMHYAPDVHEHMTVYMQLRLLSTGVVVGLEALGNYYGGMGNTSMAMRANVVAMAGNVALNWLLIDGNLGFPAMGVKGAALASVLSSSAGFAGLLGVFLWQGRVLPRARLRMAEFWRLLRFGFPSGLNWAFEFYAFIAFVNVVVAGLGTSSLGALMSVIQINSVAFMPAFGVASSGAILVGQSIGAGRKDDVPGLVKLAFMTNAAWMGVAGLAYVLVPELLLKPFVSPDTDGTFLKVGATMLMMSSLWQLTDAAGITLSEALRAAGDTSFTMWVRGGLAWLVFLPGSWWSVRHMGGTETAAMAWLVAYLGLLAAALFLRFRNGAWRNINLVQDEQLV